MKRSPSLKLALLSILAVFALSGSGLTTIASWQEDLTVGNATITSGAGHQAGPSPWEQKIDQIAVAGDKTIAIDTTGQAWAWGDNNNYDSLPFPDTNERYYPEKFLENRTATNIWHPNRNGFLRDNKGQLWVWGANQDEVVAPIDKNPLRTPTPMTEPVTFTQIVEDQLSSTVGTVLTLDQQGGMWAWGYESDSQLFADGSRWINTVIRKPRKTVTGKNFKQLAAGAYTAYALDNDGTLWAWGSDKRYGLLATGAATNLVWDTPHIITPDKHYKQIAAGNDHVLALDTDNNLWGWGHGSSGQLTGNDARNPTPKQISLPTGKKITKIYAGFRCSIVIDATSHAWAWGNNEQGKLGVGDNQEYHYTPTPIVGSHLFTRISAGDTHTVAVDTGGHAWAWGDNRAGELGIGTTPTNTNKPVRVQTYNPTPTW